jgi:hypothetical protein
MGNHRGNRHRKNKPRSSSEKAKNIASSNIDAQDKPVEEGISSTIKPDIYVNGIKSVEDYGDYIILKADEIQKYNYKLFTKLIALPNMDCYEPIYPFLKKYKKLYYEPDGIIEDLLTCFIDW